MRTEKVDGYLLGEPISKADVVADLLANRSADPRAAAFYRALEAVGVRAADEAFIALRLVLAGRAPEDAAVRRLRAFSSVARASARGRGADLASVVARERGELGELANADSPLDPAALRERAAAAYRAELAGSG
ncbi:MAG: hypothetical protein NVS2B3_18430 [Vulcanimicrobiaceae bacterium]